MAVKLPHLSATIEVLVMYIVNTYFPEETRIVCLVVNNMNPLMPFLHLPPKNYEILLSACMYMFILNTISVHYHGNSCALGLIEHMH